jgi:GntR family transcriptional regulator
MAGQDAARGGVVLPGAESVSRALPLPLHVQIRNTLFEQIEEGRLKPGQQVPRERELAEQFGVSLAPVRQALLALAKEGYLQRIQGRGTFVRGPRVEQKIALLSSFTESLRAQGLSGAVRVIRQEPVRADSQLRAALRTRSRRVLLIERLATLEDGPVALLRAYLPLPDFADLAHEPLEGRSLYAILGEKYWVDLARAENMIEVVRCDAAESAYLGVPPGSPALLVEGVTFDSADRPVEFSRVLYRADRFRFALESHRRAGQVIHLIGHAADHGQRGGSDG